MYHILVSPFMQKQFQDSTPVIIDITPPSNPFDSVSYRISDRKPLGCQNPTVPVHYIQKMTNIVISIKIQIVP